MTSPGPELPHDIARCQTVIEQLHAQLQHATQQIVELKSAAVETRDAAARIAHLEALLAEHQATIAAQQETIEQLAADNTLLKRSLFGSRQERYEDPAQALLFPTQAQDTQAADDDQAAAKPQRKRTSKGRGRRVFPDFLPRKEERHPLNEAEIPDQAERHVCDSYAIDRGPPQRDPGAQHRELSTGAGQAISRGRTNSQVAPRHPPVPAAARAVWATFCSACLRAALHKKPSTPLGKRKF